MPIYSFAIDGFPRWISYGLIETYSLERAKEVIKKDLLPFESLVRIQIVTDQESRYIAALGINYYIKDKVEKRLV